MKLLVAESAGFCQGVKRAVELAKQGIPNKKYILGSLVHNKEVVLELKNMGIAFSDNPLFGYDEVVISAHGTTSFLYDSLHCQKITDATCVNVKKIIEIAKKIDKKSLLIMVGDINHSEVKNVISYAENVVVLPKNRVDISNLVNEKQRFCSYVLVYQTTLDEEIGKLYYERIKELIGNKLVVIDTRCPSVKRRIDESIDIAKQIELMIVLGDKTSANCNTIFNECKKYNQNTIFIENENELPQINFETVGLTAGASVSPKTLERVKNKLENTSNL